MELSGSDSLQWVLPVSDPGYREALAVRAQHPELYPRVGGLCTSLWICALLVVLRYLEHGLFCIYWRRVPKTPLSSSNSSATADRLEKLEEGTWVTTGGTLLAVASWHCLHSVRSKCSFQQSAGCVANWPMIPLEPYVDLYYNLELGWYLHLMVKQRFGLGLADTATMAYHHLATVGLVVTSYYLNMQLTGLLFFALMNLSTPLLHLSKLAHLFHLKNARAQLFAGFAVVFFFSRVLAFPAVVLKCIVMEPATHIRGLFQYFLLPWLVGVVLLVVLSVMQVVWFVAILRILRAVQTGNDTSIDKEVARRDVLLRKNKAC